MISRKSTMALSLAYYHRFTYMVRERSGIKRQIINADLYDFLYLNNFDVSVLNAFKSLPSHNPQELKDFIMQLHTGESVNAPQWNWGQRQLHGQQILKDLAECLIRERLTDPLIDSYGIPTTHAIDNMKLSLELDGYVYRDNKLRIPEETVLDEAEEQGVLESLMISLGLSDIPTLKHHLELSATDYQESHWGDSISNSRKVLEGILTQAAVRFIAVSGDVGLSEKELERAAAVRDYLERSGILEKKEKDAIASVYGLLSDTGGHPYIAGQDQARLMRHLFLTFSQFVLLRLEGAIRAKGK